MFRRGSVCHERIGCAVRSRHGGISDGPVLIGLLRTYARPYRRLIVMLVGLQAIQAMAMLYLPTLTADVVDNGVVQGDTGYILRRGALMLGVAMLQLLCALGAVGAGAHIAMALGRDLRARVFDQVLRFSSRELGQFGAATLVNRTINDVQQAQLLTLMALTRMVSAPVMGVGGVVLALRQDVPMSLLLLTVVPLVGLIVVLLVRRIQPLSRGAQERTDAVHRLLREQITGVRVVRAFVRQRYEQRRFAAANQALTDMARRAGQLSTLMVTLTLTLVTLAIVPVIWLGAYRIDSGGMQIGGLFAFLGYLLMISTSVALAAGALMQVPRAQVAAARIQEVLRTEPSLATPPALPGRPPRRGRLELSGLEFRYPAAEAAVLRGVDLTVEPGEVTAITGSTGAGKSTLLGLIARLYLPTAGRVLIDGHDLRSLDRQTLSTIIGLVPQRPYLFSGTVASNLRYGRPDANDDLLWRSLEVAQARDFVERLDGGLSAPVAQGGANFSGGERQRLAIARALVRQPSIYLFDDPFAAVDYATEARLRAALAQEVADATVVLASSRASTIRAADRIVVLDAGRVTGAGTHDELAAAHPLYREFLLSQAEEERCG